MSDEVDKRFRSRKFWFCASTWVTSHALLLAGFIDAGIYAQLMFTILGLYAVGSIAGKAFGSKK